VSEAVRVGVVGLGQWGRQHARVFSTLPGVELAGVADRDTREVEAAALRHRTRGFTDYHELIGRVDAASVVVPTVLHYPVARDLLDAGIHVLLEKPMTATVDEARRLVDLSQRRGTVMLVGHVERFKPVVQRLRDLARDPLHIQARRVRPYDPTRVMDVGVVLDLMIHDIDIVLALAPGRVVEVGGVGVRVHNNQEDLAVAHLTLESGCRVTLIASRVSAVKAVEMEITTPERSIHLDFLREIMQVRTFGGEPQRLVMDGVEPLRAELSHFVACIRGEERPRVSGEDGARALEVTHRLLRSLIGISPGVPA
jgi:predicted dehydrogenase